MTSPTIDPGTDADRSLMWGQLSEHLDALLSAWEQADEPPALADFLPPGPPALRRLTLVESIKIDLEYRWKSSRWVKRIEDYLQEFPELAEGDGLPCDIIYEEFHIRRQLHETVSPEEYLERFPEQASQLCRLLDLEAPHVTTSLTPIERVRSFNPGEHIDDFDLLSRLGQGAFASVFLARQRSMQRLVALKISSDRGFEPQTLAQLDHPHIVRVFDQRQITDKKLRLLYMQYVPGGTLHSVIDHASRVLPEMKSGGTLLAAVDRALAAKNEQPPGDSLSRYRLKGASWPEVVCWIGTRLANALAYAHQRGILHRDLKPANVLVGADCQPLLADFNISFSKLDGATPAAYFGGSVAYMSPEQLEASNPNHDRQPADLDGRSDVYSLGVLLWEMLTGRRPFAENNLPNQWSGMLAAMTAARFEGVPAEARALVPPRCPRCVVDVLLKCLAPRPEDRYASAAEVARQLDLCLQPRAQSLLERTPSWRTLLKRHPALSTLLIGLVPNIVLCILNIVYNLAEILAELGPTAEQKFYILIGLINSISYAGGLGYVFFTRGAMFRTLAQLAGGKKVDPPPSDQMVRRCLNYGSVGAILTVTLWGISGFVFPAMMQWWAGEMMTAEKYRHFIISNLLCGMVAATQTYYVITFLVVRNCYPWLFEARSGNAQDVSELTATARRSRIFLGLTVAVPFCALSAVVIINFKREIIGALGGLGLLDCALAYQLDLIIRGDLAALVAMLSSSGDSLGSSHSLDSLFAESRR